MEVIVYSIKSLKDEYWYVGITKNLEDRLRRHNGGHNISTAPHAPFQLIYEEAFLSYSEARNKEKFLKSGVGRKFLDTLIS